MKTLTKILVVSLIVMGLSACTKKDKKAAISGDEFYETFDNSQMPAGWTTIDADGDGHAWKLSTEIFEQGHGCYNSADMIVSQSYINDIGPLTPDNYLVTPKVKIGKNAKFSFYACAQDGNYSAEHFSILISTADSSDVASYQTLGEWTISKAEGLRRPRGENDQSMWILYSVDLSYYYGQDVFLAIRHHDCTDQYILDVDCIRLEASNN